MPEKHLHLKCSLKGRLSYLLLFAASPYLLEARDGVETFPVTRSLENLREAALQTVGRDGPRYPDEGFVPTVQKYRAVLSKDRKGSSHDAGDGTIPFPDDCVDGYAVLTMANVFAMETLVPLLLESLYRIDVPSETGESRQLSNHALVVGVNSEAIHSCIRLRRRYRNGCLSDYYSGLYEGDNRYPDFKYLAYGMAKLKYIVNVLSTGTSVLYVDADVFFLQNPFPELFASKVDIAVATAPAPCGTQPSKPDLTFLDSTDDAGKNASGPNAARQLQQEQRQGQALHGHGRGGDTADAATAALGYAPGITFYRSAPGAMRCTFSLLLDMFSATRKNPNAKVVEQEHFATFMPLCVEVLGLQLAELNPRKYLTGCGTDVATKMGDSDRSNVVAVHVSGAPGTSLRDRLPVMEDLLGVKVSQLIDAAANNEELEGVVSERRIKATI